jgi:hypothetical protein
MEIVWNTCISPVELLILINIDECVLRRGEISYE